MWDNTTEVLGKILEYKRLLNSGSVSNTRFFYITSRGNFNSLIKLMVDVSTVKKNKGTIFLQELEIIHINCEGDFIRNVQGFEFNPQGYYLSPHNKLNEEEYVKLLSRVRHQWEDHRLIAEEAKSYMQEYHQINEDVSKSVFVGVSVVIFILFASVLLSFLDLI
jgi:hypothetical protein